jgi:hypothetical protein
VVFAENFAVAIGVDVADMSLRLIAVGIVLTIALMHAFVPKWGVRIMVCWRS